LATAFAHLDSDLLALPSQQIPDFDKLTPEEIKNLDPQLLHQAAGMILPAITGACGIIAMIQNNDLFIANAGDCRAVLGSTSSKWKRFAVEKNNEEQQQQEDSEHAAVQLSKDHQASDPQEMERLRKEHPGEEKTVAFAPSSRETIRVLGGLMPSRSFGDGKVCNKSSSDPLNIQLLTIVSDDVCCDYHFTIFCSTNGPWKSRIRWTPSGHHGKPKYRVNPIARHHPVSDKSGMKESKLTSKIPNNFPICTIIV
jgi:serine/threonine protein phosphatase PrpC